MMAIQSVSPSIVQGYIYTYVCVCGYKLNDSLYCSVKITEMEQLVNIGVLNWLGWHIVVSYGEEGGSVRWYAIL